MIKSKLDTDAYEEFVFIAMQSTYKIKGHFCLIESKSQRKNIERTKKDTNLGPKPPDK